MMNLNEKWEQMTIEECAEEMQKQKLLKTYKMVFDSINKRLNENKNRKKLLGNDCEPRILQQIELDEKLIVKYENLIKKFE